MTIRPEFNLFLAAHGVRPIHTLDVPAGDLAETSLQDKVELMIRQKDSEVNTALNPAVDAAMETILKKANQEMGDGQGPVFSLYPTDVHCGSDLPGFEGLMAVQLNPINFMNGDKTGNRYRAPMAVLFIDTTPGVDGIQYSIEKLTP